MKSKSEVESIAEVKERLTGRFSALSAEQVSATVERIYTQFADSTVRDFIPLLVERRADRELSEQPEALEYSAA